MSKSKVKKTYSFTLVLGDVREVTEEMADALFEAGCDDASPSSSCGVVRVAFDREAVDFRSAVASAVRDVAKAGFRAVRVEPDDLVSAAEIAERLGRSRESIRLLASGERGPGNFPAPVVGVGRRFPFYRWTEVLEWLRLSMPEEFAAGKLGPLADGAVAEARWAAAINGALDLYRYANGPAERQAILEVAEGVVR